MTEAHERPDGTGAHGEGDQDHAPDAEWFTLTQGLTPYERFRFIARHVMAAALAEATDYAVDQRIFEDIDDEQAIKAHLEILDMSLKDDPSLTVAEREFLCGAVAAALRNHELEAACLWDLILPRRPVRSPSSLLGDDDAGGADDAR